MAVPTVTDTTENVQNIASTTLTVDMPATRPDGDFFLAICFKDDNPAWTDIPPNWTEIFQTPDVTNVRLGAWWWVGDGEPASYSLTMDSEIATSVVVRIDGANLQVPIDDFDTATGSSTNALAPESTVTQADTLVIRAAAVDRDDITGTQATELAKGGLGGANDVGHGVSAENGPASGGTGTAEFTNDTDEWVAGTIVIAPFAAFVANDLSDVAFPDQNYFVGPFEV